MDSRSTRLAALAAGAFILYPAFTLFYSSGAPAMRTGAPNPTGFEATCNASDCHDSNPLNSGGGSVTVTAPATYAPGSVVEFTVNVEHAGMAAAGFQLAVKNAGRQHVGTLQLVAGAGTQFADGLPQYVTHASPKESGQWTVRWVAPPSPVGDVTVYVAGNAVNLNGQPTGDFIYTSNVRMQPAGAVAAEEEDEALSLRMGAAFPNPFRSETTLPFTLAGSGEPVTVAVYDLAGRRLSSRSLGVLRAGSHEAEVRAGNWPDGVYFVEISTARRRDTRAVLLAK